MEEEKKEESCKGLIYRGYTNTFINSKGTMIRKESLRLMKMKSCRGCAICGPIRDDIREYLDAGSLIFPEIEQGEFYSIQYSDISTDWESGIEEAESMTFFKIKLDKVNLR